MFIPAHLAISRHGIYYFRWPLPAALHPERKSSTIKVSLQTRDPKEALRWSRLLSYVGQVGISYGIGHGMTFEEIRKLLFAHFSQMLTERKAQIAMGGRLSQLDISAFEGGRAFAQEAVQDGGSLIPDGNDDELVSRFMDKYGLDIQPGTDAYKNLGTELKRAYRDYCSSVLNYDRSLDNYQFENATNAKQDEQRINVDLSHLSLQQLADLYTKDSNLGDQWASKTQQEKAGHISLLMELLDANKDVAALSSTDAQRVKDTLTRYPKNRNKDPKTRNLPLHEALDVEGIQIINVQTINKYLRTYGSMFGWAKRNGYIDKNVFEGLNVRLGKKQKSKTTRTAFTEQQTQAILYELLNNSKGVVRTEYQKWGPLIALYSGARLNEIAQIHLADILERYPLRESGALSKVADVLGLRSRGEYENVVRTMLQQDEEAIAYLRGFFGDLVTEINPPATPEIADATLF